MNRKRVAAYCRVSTAMEAQEGSYETQVSYYREMIGNNPKFVLVDINGDHGASGLSTQRRHEFQRMLRDCENGKIDLILSKSISRFARNLTDCIGVIRRLRRLGVGVYFEKEKIDTGTPFSEMLLTILAAFARRRVGVFLRTSNGASESGLRRGRRGPGGCLVTMQPVMGNG